MDVMLLLVFIFICLCLWKLCSKPANFPPGPPRWPVVGNLLAMRGRILHEAVGEFSRKYGSVVGVYMGHTPLVIISDLAAAKEASNLEELSGRPRSALAYKLGGGRIHGIIFSQGELWRENRRFALRHLRDLGFGKKSMEGLIHEELEAVIKEIDGMIGDGKTPIDLFQLIGTAIVNILWHVIAGQRYEYGDARLQRLLHLSKELLTQTDASGGIGQNFPLLFKLCPKLTEYDKILEVKTNVHNFIREDLEIHRKTLDPESPRDFLDMYLIEMEKQKSNPNTMFFEKQLLDLCKDLFLAGNDTTFNSITYALAYMLNFQRVQSRVQDEIDQVVGPNRLPSLEDRPKMVYTDATLHELMRMTSVVPLSVPHAPLENDVNFRGYFIPKNSRVLFNLIHIHMDPKIWGDPENFRPERFISDDGKLIRREALIPFGSGKRQCIGESLARSNSYLIFTAILQRYSLVVPPGEKPPSLDPTGGFTIAPKPFKCLLKQRF